MTSQSVPFVRTPDSNFDGLADFPYGPHYLHIGALRIHYIDEGPVDGLVALMVHGMPTWSYLYRHIIEVLVAAGYRCVAPDHIGFGRSDKVTDPAWYNIARHTANLGALVRELDLRNITLLAQDWGGPTGLAQAVTMPERFSRLVIMNTWLHHDGYEYSPAIRRWIAQNMPGGIFRDNIPGRFNWGTLMAVGTRRAEPQQALFPALQGAIPDLPDDVEAVRTAYDAPFAGLREDGVIGSRQFPLCIPLHDHARGDGDTQAGHFQSINATSLPVHFIWGLADDIFTGDWGRTWHSFIHGSTWDAFDDAAHFLQDTHGTRIAELILRYSR